MKDSDNIFAAVRESRRFAALVSGAAEKGQLKKCSFSMPLDRSVKKAQAVACTIGGRRMLQLELFLVDGKAIQRNIAESDVEALAEFARGFLRANLIPCRGAVSTALPQTETQSLSEPLRSKHLCSMRVRYSGNSIAATTERKNVCCAETRISLWLWESAPATAECTIKNSRNSGRYAAFSSTFRR